MCGDSIIQTLRLPHTSVKDMLLMNLLVLLHVITAAGWFGLALVIGGMARKAAAGADKPLVDEGTKTVKLMNVFIVLTLVFGLLAFLVGGGFGAYGPQYHTSLLLIIVLTALQFFLIGPAWSSIADGGSTASGAKKRISMGTGAGHLIWLIVLILMFWNHYPLA